MIEFNCEMGKGRLESQHIQTRGQLCTLSLKLK